MTKGLLLERMLMMVDYRHIDEALIDYLQQNTNHWLLNQTLVNAKMRRDILGMLPIQPHSKILDVGTGFGAVSFDLASQFPVQIEAIDVEPERIEIAKEIQTHFNNKSLLNGSISFSNEDLYKLPYRDQQFDFVIAWFVFQHLKRVEEAIEALKRVIVPGGLLCIVDVDDQFAISYPSTSESEQFMQKSFRSLQEKRGGDRYIGRKLPSYLHNAGLNVVGTGIQAQSQFAVPTLQDPARTHEIKLYKELEKELIKNKIMTKDKFDAHIQELMQEKPVPTYKTNAQFIVLGQVPEEN